MKSFPSVLFAGLMAVAMSSSSTALAFFPGAVGGIGFAGQKAAQKVGGLGIGGLLK